MIIAKRFMVDKLAQRAQAILNTPVYYYLGYKTVSYRLVRSFKDQENDG